ncbi:MAG: tail fiber domain-containing protein [bacterium]
MKKPVLLLISLAAIAAAGEVAAVTPQAIDNRQSTIADGPDAVTIPRLLSYQGRLADTTGRAVPDTLYAVRFRLYEQPSGGTQFWEETQDVQTRSGLFSVLLGSLTPIGNLPRAGTLHLGMAVAGGAEMVPRLRVASAAYAFLAERARRADTADYAPTTLPDTIPGSLAIGGELRVHSKVRLGAECSNSGEYAFCAGYRNGAFGDRSSVSGGEDISCAGYAAHVGGGTENQTSGPYATVGGGYVNVVDDTAGTVAGGWENVARGKYAVIGGGQYNTAENAAATVGGGCLNTADGPHSTVAGGYSNRAVGYHSTVGGGSDNEASGGHAVVAGGYDNVASNYHAAVSGGQRNTAGGQNSMIPGGYWNTTNGLACLAAGEYARANHSGSFVWGDANAGPNDTIYTTGSHQFRVRASGGTWFFSNRTLTTGAYLAAGSNSWASACDSATKEDFRPVDRKALLDKVAALRVRNYKMRDQDDGTRHIGPVAQDFAAAFGVGENNTSINMADADGVLLAAVQALYEQNQTLSRRVAELEAQLPKR